MNERGVAVAMAAVPAARSPARGRVGARRTRLVLDRAANVAEAVAIFRCTAVDFTGGPPLDIIIADATGASAVTNTSTVACTCSARPPRVDDELHPHRRRAADDRYCAAARARARAHDVFF